MSGAQHETRGASHSGARAAAAGEGWSAPSRAAAPSRRQAASVGVAPRTAPVSSQPATHAGQLAAGASAPAAPFSRAVTPRKWEAAHIALVLDRHGKGQAHSVIADALRDTFGARRSADSVRSLLTSLRKRGQANDDPLANTHNRVVAASAAATRARLAREASATQRECRLCLKQFPSAHIGNRVCRPCKEGEIWRAFG